ncbi:MAG: transcription elongation factor GreA, partial [Spirochaetota bacterium]
VTDKLDHFVVRDQPISFAEKTFNQFKAERNFFERVKTMYEFLRYIEDNDEEEMDSDLFREMFDYFAAFLRSQGVVNEYVVGSSLLVRRIVEKHPYLNLGIDLEFEKLFDSIPNLEETFDRLENNDLRREFTRQVRKHIKEWPNIFVRLFPYYLSKDIVTELERAGKENKLRELFQEIYNNYRDMREPFVWMARNCIEDEWIKESAVDYERILIAMIHLLDITAREIDNRKDATFNRKINRQIHSFLFKDGRLHAFVESADEDSLNRVFTLVGDVKDLDPSLVIDLKQRILDRFPDFHFYGQVEKETVSWGFIVTEKSYNEKQKALQHLHEVEVPENSREIAEAAAHGDLRENAEYKAAKERQDMLNSTAARLKEELEKAQIVKQRDVDPEKVAFGTKVKLLNHDLQATEEYVVLGPWESDPSNHVISYLSPLGAELVNSRPGEELEFVINDREYKYRVEEVTVADF